MMKESSKEPQEAGDGDGPRVVYLRDAPFVRTAASIMLVLAAFTCGLALYRFNHGQSDGSELTIALKLWHGSDVVAALPTLVCGLGLYGFDPAAVLLTRYMALYTFGICFAVAAVMAYTDDIDKMIVENIFVRVGFWSASWWYTQSFKAKIAGLKEA